VERGSIPDEGRMDSSSRKSLLANCQEYFSIFSTTSCLLMT